MNMKKIVLSLAIVMTAMASCKKANNVVLFGTIENAKGEQIVLEEIGLRETIKVDSVKISEDGKFELLAPNVSEPTFYRATLSGSKTITIIADSLESVSVTADANSKNWYSDVKFENSEESTKLQQVIQKAFEIQKNITILRNNASLSEEERELNIETITNEIADYKDFVKQNVFKNPQSMVNYYALYQSVLDMSIFDIMNADDQILFNTVATSLQIAYPNSERVKVLCNDVLQARTIQKKMKQNQELLDNAVEVKSPDLSMTDIEGNEVKLSSLRGKTVILQFWASYNEDSRSINKQLANIYKKYHNKGLEIYQVSFDTSKVLWEDASQRDGICWINVCDLMGQYSPATSIYNISSLPSNYIIAPDGALIGKNLFGTRLDNKMADLFK